MSQVEKNQNQEGKIGGRNNFYHPCRYSTSIKIAASEMTRLLAIDEFIDKMNQVEYFTYEFYDSAYGKPGDDLTDEDKFKLDTYYVALLS